MCDIMCDCVSGGGAGFELSRCIIKEEVLEEAVVAWGSRNWMMDYGMFCSFQQPAHNNDGCPSLLYHWLCECSLSVFYYSADTLIFLSASVFHAFLREYLSS